MKKKSGPLKTKDTLQILNKTVQHMEEKMNKKNQDKAKQWSTFRQHIDKKNEKPKQAG